MKRTLELTKRDVLGLAAGALTAAVAAPAHAQPAAPASPATVPQATVKIGMVVPLSGPWAGTGEAIKAGADLAVDDINQAGGIKALGGARVVLVAADAEDSAEKAKNAAQRMLSREPDLIGGIGDALSSMTLVVTELAERAELPWITMTFADMLTERGSKYLFEAVPVASVQAANTLPTVLDLAQSVTGKRPATAAIIADSNQALQSMVKVLRDTEFAKYNVKLVSERTYTPPLSDPSQLIEELRRSRPDFLLLLPSNLPDLKLLLDKMNEFGLGRGRLPTITVGGATGSPDLLKVETPDILENLIGVFATWPGKAHEAIVERFKQRTGKPWMTADNLNAYGEVMILRDAVEKAGVADRRKVAEQIRAMNTTEGAAAFFTGKLQFDDKGRRTDAPLVVVQWQGGMPRPVFPQALATAKPVWGTK